MKFRYRNFTSNQSFYTAREIELSSNFDFSP